jgi:carbonic anhydrase
MSKFLIFLFGAIIFLSSCEENGTRLSPIDISDTEKSDELIPLYADYLQADKFVINNTGKTISVYVDSSVLVIPDEDDYLGTELNLERFDIKSPSEHKVNDEHFPLELQFHHVDSAGKIVIASVFVIEGEENIEFQIVIDNIPKKGDPEKIETPIDVYYLFSIGENYWTYNGTYTDKPYEGNVEWYIMQDPIEVSKAQINAIVDAIGKNKKEVVELGDRKIIEF